MDRSNIAIVSFVVLLVALFGAAVTSQSWVPLFVKPDRGIGMIVVATFISAHIALTVGLAWATISAAAKWRRNITHRTKLNQLLLATGIIGVGAAITYAVFFVSG